MLSKLNSFLDVASNFFAQRKGLIPLLGIFCVVLDFVIQFVATGWIAETNFFEHLGVILIAVGFLLASAL